MESVLAAIEQYADMGFDTLPLRPGTKKALSRNWQRLTPVDMWRDAPTDANLGLRAGGLASLAVIDCDDKNCPGTLTNIQRWLEGLGYSPNSYPLIRTASGLGGQIYTQWGGGLEKHARDISDKFGSGEFRYGQGAYVAAPPSVVGSRRYELIQGDLLQRPFLTAKDILQILKAQEITPERQVISDTTPNRIPRQTFALLKGIGVKQYPSRSHAEQAILTGLVNKRFDFEQALSLFMRYPCAGKFQEKYGESPQTAVQWLRTSFESAVNFTGSNESEARRVARSALEWAKSRPWKGKTGLYDKLVYIAHATIAFRAGRLEYGVSARDLAGITGLSPEACLSATERLCEAGLLTYIKSWVASLSNIYRLESQSLTLPHSGGEGSVKVWD